MVPSEQISQPAHLSTEAVSHYVSEEHIYWLGENISSDDFSFEQQSNTTLRVRSMREYHQLQQLHWNAFSPGEWCQISNSA